jgi:hypothetical protein
MAIITNLRRWRNGDIINARDYVYERDLIVSLVNEHETKIQLLQTLIDKIENDSIPSIIVSEEEPVGQEDGDFWYDIL